jgi:hypothetical protein
MRGHTYFCTDSLGHDYRRYSVGHGEPQYRYACITRGKEFRGPVDKDQVGYSRNADGASAMVRRWRRIGWESEFVAVRAYPGNHKLEPGHADRAAAKAAAAKEAAEVAQYNALIDAAYPGKPTSVEDTDLPVLLSVAGEPLYPMPLRRFFEENGDAIDTEERFKITETVLLKGTYLGGGGSQPGYTLTLDEDALRQRGDALRRGAK